MTKRCFKCGLEKDVADFYRHPMMADGRLGKCKECAKADVRDNYRVRRASRRAYEKMRNRRPERREKARKYSKRRRARDPLRYKARTAVGNALRDGRLKRQPCGECGSTKRVQAHHHDYAKPLDVEWLCFPCHRELRHGQKVGP